MKYHELSVLKSRYLFLTVLESRKSMSKVQADMFFEESSLPGLCTAVFLLPSAYLTFPPWAHVERER